MSAYPFGNIDTIESYQELFKSEGFKTLLRGSIERRAKCKESCQYYPECAGGCADCAIAEGSLSNPPSFSCYCFQNIYPYIQQKVAEVKASGLPLSEFNPALRKTWIRCMSVCDSKAENEIADKFV